MKINQLIPTILLSLTLSAITAGPAYSADLNVTCDNTNCTQNPEASLFDHTILAPGETITKSLSIHNTAGKDRQFILDGQNATYDSDLADETRVNLINDRSVVIFSGSLSQFIGRGELDLGIIPNGQTREYTLDITFPASFTNDYQAKKYRFDLKLGFAGQNPGVDTSSTSTGPSTPVFTPANLAASQHRLAKLNQHPGRVLGESTRSGVLEEGYGPLNLSFFASLVQSRLFPYLLALFLLVLPILGLFVRHTRTKNTI